MTLSCLRKSCLNTGERSEVHVLRPILRRQRVHSVPTVVMHRERIIPGAGGEADGRLLALRTCPGVVDGAADGKESRCDERQQLVVVERMTTANTSFSGADDDQLRLFSQQRGFQFLSFANSANHANLHLSMAVLYQIVTDNATDQSLVPRFSFSFSGV